MKLMAKVGCCLVAGVALNAVAGTLPAGYTEVSNLEFHGAEKLSVPVTFTATGGFGVAMKARVTSRPGDPSTPHVLNAGDLWLVYRAAGIFLGNTLKKELALDVDGKSFYPNSGIGQDIAVEFNTAGDGANTVNGAVPRDTFSVAGFKPASLCIGQYSGGSGYGLNGYFYYLRLYDQGVLKMNLIPCVKQDGSVPGLYDTENPDPSKAFHVNVGGGQLTPGAALANDLLTIDALPADHGGAEVQPPYGLYAGYAAGQTEKLTAPAEWINADESELYELIGWTLSKPNGTGWETIDGEMSAVCDYTHPDPPEERKVTWLWRHFYRFDATATGPGVSVSPASQWVEKGSNGVVSATLSSRRLGVYWTGTGATFENCTQKTLTLTGDRVRRLSAMATSDQVCYGSILKGGDWQELSKWKGSVSNLVFASAAVDGSGITYKGAAMTVCFPRIDDNEVLHVQFQVFDHIYLKCVLAEFKVEGGFLYGRKTDARYGVGSVGSVNFEKNPGTQNYSGYDVRKIIALTPYDPKPGFVISIY